MSLISGNVTFNSGSVNYSVNANVIVGASNFCGDAQNCGLISSGYFFDTAANVGTISCNAVFAGTAINSGTASVAVFSGNAINCSSVTTCAIFVDTAVNAGSVTYASFCGSGVNEGIVSQNASFYGTAVNCATVCGNATFSDTAINDGNIEGNAVFGDSTSNIGTVEGDAEIAVTATNSGSVVGNATTYEHQYQYGYYWADDSPLILNSTKIYTGQYTATLFPNADFTLGTDGQSGYNLIATNANGIVSTITVVNHSYSDATSSYFWDNSTLSNGNIVYAGRYTNTVAANASFTITGYDVSTNGNGIATLTASIPWYNDSSSQTHTVTLNGSATQSNEGNGVKAVELTNSATLLTTLNNDLGSGDFTIEVFVNASSYTGGKYIIDSRTGSNWALGWGLDGSNSSNISFYDGSSGTFVQTTGLSMPSGWTHIAIVRHNNTITVYLNGVSVASSSNSTNFNGSGTLTIGLRHGNLFGVSFEGKMAGLRIVKGTAVYTSNFNIPTALLTNASGTILLLNFGATDVPSIVTSNWYDDSSSYNRNVVNNGSTLYSENGGIKAAQLSPGLTIDTNTNGSFSGNFTVEFFYKPDQLYGFPIGNLWPSAGGNSWAIGFPSDGAIYLTSATAGYGSGGNGTMNANVWNYVALVRENGVVSAYIDGNRVHIFNSAPSFTENSDIILNTADYAYPAYGKIAMVRVSDVARYSSDSHTVPTSIFSSDGNTLLLLNFGATNAPSLNGGY